MAPACTSGYVTGATSAAITIAYGTANWASGQWVNISGNYGSGIVYDDSYSSGERLDLKDGQLVVPKGRDLLLPDGTVLHIDDLGNVRIDDANAKVIYQASRMREFNPYVNASDLLASFIRFAGSLGLGRMDIGELPVALFINWLVIEAAKQDGDPIPDDITPVERHPALLRLLPRETAA